MDAKKKNFETELPGGYEAVFVVDAKTKKFTIVMNLIALVMMAAVVVPAFIILKPLSALPESTGSMLVRELVFIGSMLAYIVLHELVHGAAYKLTTGRKLTFGFTATVAYCGVPDIFVYRKASLIALLAPFTVFTIVFLALAAILPGTMDKFLCWIVFGVHFSGCVGDLYDTGLYLFKFTDPATLMQDTGPRQTFYLKK